MDNSNVISIDNTSKVFDEFYIRMPNYVTDHETLTSEALVVYALILDEINVRGYTATSLYHLSEKLQINRKSNHYDTICMAIEQLEEEQMIIVYNAAYEEVLITEVNKYECLNILCNDRLEDEYYQVPIMEMKKLIDYLVSISTKNLYGILRYYLTIRRWTNFPEGIGYIKKSVKELTSSSSRVLKKYDKMFDELGFFYSTSDFISSKTGKYVPTIFGKKNRFISKEQFMAAATEKAKIGGYFPCNKAEANDKRSFKANKKAAMKYKRAQRRLEKYDENNIEKIIELSCKAERAEMRANQAQQSINVSCEAKVEYQSEDYLYYLAHKAWEVPYIKCCYLNYSNLNRHIKQLNLNGYFFGQYDADINRIIKLNQSSQAQ